MTMQGFCECGCGAQTAIATHTRTNEGITRGQPVRYLVGHQARKSSVEYLVEDRGYETPCWIWQGAVSRGYGHKRVNRRMVRAHRAFYEAAKGPVPDGLEIDHLCRNKLCVNPGHLEAVTRAVNVQRGLNAKLTPEMVRDLRDRAGRGEPQVALAESFGVKPNTVGRIVRRETWVQI